ncbi:MAG: extracellular solute-binding protein [Phycisphaerales bacterium]|nr:extracellular solute-binding protein [Phycisphaerales bacterium]
MIDAVIDSIRRWSASLGVLVIALLAIGSSIAVVAIPAKSATGVQMWTFARLHKQMYDPIIADWPAESRPQIALLSHPALERRMLQGFLTSTPTADLIECERRSVGRAFVGPLDSVGFTDMTDRLRSEGLLEQINMPSFGPWSSRGRIFGLPHDVHPVMLGYRADIVEAAGIDVSTIETWDDFVRVLGPLMSEKGPDGKPKRYLLNIWEDKEDLIELLLLQAGGGFFDEQERVRIATPTNARVISTIVTWCRGPGRIAADAADFSASGNQLKADGYVVAAFMPDWMCNVWKNEIPQLSGKIRLMPLPAWTKGGRRTSVWGGTMLGISKTAPDQERLWKIASKLYLSPELARSLYSTGDIITPVRTLWNDPIFSEPDPYFSGQRKGRDYIALAPDVPMRTSSPYNVMAKLRVQTAVISLSAHAQRVGATSVEALEPRAMELLKVAEDQVRAQIERNVFLNTSAERPARGGV